MGLSEKQFQILTFPKTRYEALICDGAVRSGKTSIMALSFVRWAMDEFNGRTFGICGKTVQSAQRNIIMPLFGVRYLPKNGYRIKWRQNDHLLTVARGKKQNNFYVFGGKDESSYTLIQGITLAGVLMDEAALMPRSFVEQALARCSVEGSRFWFNCNPESPQHWFYKEWIEKAEEKNALHLHFVLEDNPSLSSAIVARYKSLYSGVFYQRYILGEWVMAEGLVYDFGEKNITDDVPENGLYYVSVDYGTYNAFSAGLWCVLGEKAVRIKEYYYDGRARGVQKTDAEYCDCVDELCGDREIMAVVVDPSAASFIAALKRRGYRVRKARNDVLDGIRLTSRLLHNGNIKIHRSCADAIREFGLYRWDEKSTVDKVIKENDHAMDDIRYFCATILRRAWRYLEYAGGEEDEDDGGPSGPRCGI